MHWLSNVKCIKCWIYCTHVNDRKCDKIYQGSWFMTGNVMNKWLSTCKWNECRIECFNLIESYSIIKGMEGQTDADDYWYRWVYYWDVGNYLLSKVKYKSYEL